MKTLLRSIIPLVALVVLIQSSRAAAPAEAQPQGWLGVLLDDGGSSQRNANAMVPPSTDPDGVRVRAVVAGSPADEARLRANDSIVAIDGVPVSGAQELMARLRELQPGSFVKLAVRRAGHDLEMSSVLGSRPERDNRLRMIRGWLGVEAIELPASLREHFGAPEDAGVLVSRVAEGSPAADSGIRVGDVIYEADGQPVTSAEALSQFVSEAGVENTIDVVLARDGGRIVVSPQIARAP